jgi:hypothetical protein
VCVCVCVCMKLCSMWLLAEVLNAVMDTVLNIEGTACFNGAGGRDSRLETLGSCGHLWSFVEVT